MKHLVIGGRGLVGTALCSRLAAKGIEYHATTRQKPREGEFYFDLASSEMPDELMSFDVIYIVAAMSKFAACEGSSLAWQVNVDTPLRIALSGNGFPIFVSSSAVENMAHTAYGRHKAHVEAVMLARGNGAIVRPSQIVPARANEVADLLIDIGHKLKPGLTRWA